VNWDWFIDKFQRISDIDLSAYKRPQMERRINSFMRQAGANDYASFIKLLEADKQVYRRFIEHLTINVSEFFRNPRHWDVLQHQIFNRLIKNRLALKVWSAGCSTGEEPYSLAIMLNEMIPGKFRKILATDIDREVLEKAKAGLFSARAVQGVPEPLLKKYFHHDGEGFRVRDKLKSLITFQRHDLLKDRYPLDMDLILCRNVVIYFTEEAKEKLYGRFADSLRPGGVLFVGSTEQIFKAGELGLKSVSTFFYEKA
jgi:chemotaxis protein methyltransferase CheR